MNLWIFERSIVIFLKKKKKKKKNGQEKMCFRKRTEEISDVYLTLTLIRRELKFHSSKYFVESYTILFAPDIKWYEKSWR